MKLPQKKSKKALLITVTAILLVAVAATTYVYAFNGSILGWTNKKESSRSVNEINYDAPTKEQIDAGKTIEKENQSDNPNNVGSDRPVEPQKGAEKSTVPIVISAAGQNGAIAQIRTLISAIVTDGNCTLTLTQNGKTVTRTAAIQSLPSSATCKGFDVPVSELGAGKWQITVTFENATIKSSATSTITLQEVVQ